MTTGSTMMASPIMNVGAVARAEFSLAAVYRAALPPERCVATQTIEASARSQSGGYLVLMFLAEPMPCQALAAVREIQEVIEPLDPMPFAASPIPARGNCFEQADRDIVLLQPPAHWQM
jgi:hypothetical protein